MGFCRRCGLRYPEGHNFCPLDGAELFEPDDDMLGRVLVGKYRILERIGTGGMGSVYRAIHVHREYPVAIKVLSAVFEKDEEFKVRFLREARAAALVRHDNMVDVIDFEETDDELLFMAMELLEGETLGQVISRGPMPMERVVPILRQVCGVLGPTHAMGIVHRDLKPENIFLVEREGQPDFVKLLDFGIARFQNEPGLTGKDVILGTPEFMSPEAIVGQDPGPPSDLYCLGCVAYAMATGHPPFFHAETVRIMSQQLTGDPPPMEGIPAAFSDIIMKLLEKKPEDRYADAYAVVRDLDGFMPKRVSDVWVRKIEVDEEASWDMDPRVTSHSTLVGHWKDFAQASRERASETSRQIVDELEARTGELEAVNRKLEGIASVMQELEDERGSTGRRLQHAIDQLAGEASGTRFAIMKRRARLNEIERDLENAEGSARGTLARRAGNLEREIAERESQLGDLLFQIATMSKRLREVIEEIERKLEEKRISMQDLDQHRASVEEQLCRLSTFMPSSAS